LRSRGSNGANYAANVNNDGSVNGGGYLAGLGVRPALWLNL
jgi:hypothetical protein